MPTTTAGLAVRPMRAEDLPLVERLIAERYAELDGGTDAPRRPEAVASDPLGVLRRRQLEHVLRHDPGGCWVAEDASGPVGVAASLKRELTWVLAVLAVRPGPHSEGVSRRLLEAAATHGRGCLRGMAAVPDEPGAARGYRLAGFALHPTMLLTGRVAREELPMVERVREGSAGDVDLMDSVDRQVRDSAHGVDHELLAAAYRLVVVDRSTGSGYAYVAPDGGPYLLAATNRRTATDLLWETLAASSPDRPVAIPRVTAANQWALEVGVTAGLDVHTSGYLGLRDMKPPTPYLPGDLFL